MSGLADGHTATAAERVAAHIECANALRDIVDRYAGDPEARHGEADAAVLKYLRVIAPGIAYSYSMALDGAWWA